MKKKNFPICRSSKPDGGTDDNSVDPDVLIITNLGQHHGRVARVRTFRVQDISAVLLFRTLTNQIALLRFQSSSIISECGL
jgi:hypothetical protein